jgi:hypothetical protein
MPRLSRIFLIVVALQQSSSSAQNLIANGSFEAPVVASNTVQLATPTSWAGGPFGVILNGTNPSFPTPQDGQQHAAVATSESLSQGFAISSAALYTLRWYDHSGFEPGGPTSAIYSANILDSTSQVVATASHEAFHPGNWAERSLGVNLTPGNYTLSFNMSGSTPGGLSAHIDNVSLTAIPEPPAISLLLAAGLAVASTVRARINGRLS